MFSAENVRAIVDNLQLLMMLIFGLTLGLSIYIARHWRKLRPYMWAVMTLAAHGFVYYIAAYANLVNAPYTSLWSVVLRLHSAGILLVVLVSVIVIFRRRDKRRE